MSKVIAETVLSKQHMLTLPDNVLVGIDEGDELYFWIVEPGRIIILDKIQFLIAHANVRVKINKVKQKWRDNEIDFDQFVDEKFRLEMRFYPDIYKMNVKKGRKICLDKTVYSKYVDQFYSNKIQEDDRFLPIKFKKEREYIYLENDFLTNRRRKREKH